MNVVFRCDGNAEIGAGHLVRCGALAREITRRGGWAALACRPIPEALRWATAGVETTPLLACSADDRAGLQGKLGAADLLGLLDAARRWQADWIVADQYGASGGYLEGIASAGYRLAALDDPGGRDLRAADLVVNPNLGTEAISYDTAQRAALCVGPHYAALRAEFEAERRRLARVNRELAWRQPVKRIFVGFGGSRLGSIGEEIAEAITSWVSGVELNVAAGLDAAAMAAAMSGAGVAVSASGSTVWELCCLGVPAVVWPIADNQRGIAAALDRAGAAVVVESVGEMLAAARELVESPEKRAAVGRAAWKLVDGRGAERVVDAMERLTFGGPAAKVPLTVSDSTIGAGGNR